MSKKSGPTSDELLAQFDSLSTAPAASTRPPKTVTAKARSSGPAKSSQTESDLLKDLGDLAKPTSRPGTPSLKPNTSSTAASRSPVRTSTATPPPGRSSEEKASAGGLRKSGDSARSTQPAYTPATTTAGEESPEPEPTPSQTSGGGGGWWGGFLSSATAAVSQAQKAVQDIQKNEDAQKYFEQVRGNVGVIKGFGEFIFIEVGQKRSLTTYRRRSKVDSYSNIHKHPADHCTAHLAARATTNPRYTRPYKLPNIGPTRIPSLLTSHVASRRRRPHGRAERARIDRKARLIRTGARLRLMARRPMVAQRRAKEY